MGNYGEIHGSQNFLSLEKLPNPRGAACLLCLHPYLLPAFPAATKGGCQRAQIAHGKEEEEKLQKQAESRVSTKETQAQVILLCPPAIPLPVLMEKLFSMAFPKMLQFYCTIMGLMKVKHYLLSGTSCFFSSAVNGI